MKITIEHPSDTSLAELERFYTQAGVKLTSHPDGTITGEYKRHRDSSVSDAMKHGALYATEYESVLSSSAYNNGDK